MRSFFKSMLVPVFTLAFAALGLQACSGDTSQTSSGGACTLNETKVCNCTATQMGIQTCQADGTYTVCMCEGGSGGNGGAGGGSSGTAGSGGGNCHAAGPGTCGNGMVDTETGEQCDDGDCDPTDECNNDCRLPYCGDKVIQPPETCDGGELCPPGCGVPTSSSSSSSSSSGNPCDGKLIFAGFSPVGDTKGLIQYGGIDGIDAADASCKAIGAFGMCEYQQWEQLKTDPANHMTDIDNLKTLVPQGTSKAIWLHRTTDLPGMPAGPGGRCNDWKYPTSHLADGEFVTVTNNAGVLDIQYTLDPDTVYDATNPAPHQNAGIDCFPLRPVPCCFQKCVP
ncbi:MAG TPA: hypothetical protein PK156_34010 [Polyangium sp.]|nr:hypothetical protein [Polyangium sp.]